VDLTSAPLGLLTGARRAGKTAFCRHFAEHARATGWDVAGLLSPAVFDMDIKTGILAEDLRTGDTRPMASAASSPHFDLPLGDWFFDHKALAWSNRVLEHSLPCDLLLVDELGPLEFLRGEGWVSALTAFRQPQYRLGLVVVRPELAVLARSSLPVAGTISLEPSHNPAAEAGLWWKRLSGDSTD
jgi:nucleoside-triphosphatase THEP1